MIYAGGADRADSDDGEDATTVSAVALVSNVILDVILPSTTPISSTATTAVASLSIDIDLSERTINILQDGARIEYEKKQQALLTQSEVERNTASTKEQRRLSLR